MSVSHPISIFQLSSHPQLSHWCLRSSRLRQTPKWKTGWHAYLEQENRRFRPLYYSSLPCVRCMFFQNDFEPLKCCYRQSVRKRETRTKIPSGGELNVNTNKPFFFFTSKIKSDWSFSKSIVSRNNESLFQVFIRALINYVCDKIWFS